MDAAVEIFVGSVAISGSTSFASHRVEGRRLRAHFQSSSVSKPAAHFVLFAAGAPVGWHADAAAATGGSG